MSTAEPTPTRGPSQDSNPSNPPEGGGGGNNNQMSNLYLYTFLATLLLLLAISVLIVGRSIFIRRRAHRLLEENVRNGVLPPQTGRPVVKFGAKPKLFDVYAARNTIPGRPSLGDGLLAWANLKPLSATLRRPTSPSSRAPVSQSPTPTEPPPSLLFRLVPQLRPVPRIVTSDSSAHPLETRQPHNSILTVSVMIAMPTPPTLHSSGDTIPPIQIGVTHLPVPHGLTTDAKTLSA
ncbi:hypothetical protein BJ322DRAFT_1023455 [Thelephora terrestris]|uniref:Uncharacterized protein n=1 Tax=Thelephora terrestris TaxID=56493 RepID=A0A9P6H743_9AGAM|nr:hypothetical protein BJ322DRAFT_1023455 [Thelephora terrestris]